MKKAKTSLKRKIIPLLLVTLFFACRNPIMEKVLKPVFSEESGSGNVITFTSLDDFMAWLDTQDPDTPVTYNIALKVADIESPPIKSILVDHPNIYLNIDFSGSTFNHIPYYAFDGCTNLTGMIIPSSVGSVLSFSFKDCANLISVTIPNNVSYISNNVFNGCTSLTTVTFKGTIPSSGFHDDAFFDLGNLKAVFYATDFANGTPGTYKTTAPVSSTSMWSKQ